jgi:serine/threonine protein kinase
MSNTPSRSIDSAPPQTDRTSDTPPRSLEATGSRVAPVASSGQPATVVGARPAGVGLQQIGDYLVIRKLGEGGMGAVYLAEDTRLDRKAAIKTLRPELAADPAHRERFEREAKAAARVEHDHIVPIWQIGTTPDGTPFIAMPFLQGETLDSRLQREPGANLGILLKVAKEVADGLAAAHNKGLIHRDIKPGNVWLEGDLSSKQLVEQIRRCKILDFGLVRTVDTDDSQLTASGAILGTPAYMAPEQAKGEKVDHRADLFSLGVMLYRMATGALPFQGSNAMAVLIALTTETPPPVLAGAPKLPPAFADLIDRLMSKDPAQRPQSAGEVAAVVREVIKEWQAKKAAAQPTPSGSQPVPVLLLPVPEPAPVPASNPWEEVTEADEDAPIAKAPEPAEPNRALWYIAAGALGFLALIAVLVVVIVRADTARGTLVIEINDPEAEARIKSGKLVLLGPDGKERYTLAPTERSKTIDAGAYTIRVEGADGLVPDTREIKVEKNGTARVRVALDPKLVKREPKKDVPTLDPDRRAAEYVLSVGGTVRSNDSGDVRSVADLGKEPFRLTAIVLSGSVQVSDAGLASCRNCPNLVHLNLSDTRVSDTGVAHFRDNKKLAHLDLNRSQVTDAGAAHFRGCTDLQILTLELPQLTDAGLEVFKDCKKLTNLTLSFTQVSNAGLALVKGCPNLSSVVLFHTQIGDAGLVHFKNRKSLTLLNLGVTRVTDDGLVHLRGCSNLTYLDLRKTQVTEHGVGEFARSMPQCKIVWDGPTVFPKE